jgi:hypothetical protein
VAAVEGWEEVPTLRTCYRQVDEATMLEVMESPSAAGLGAHRSRQRVRRLWA